AFAFPSVPPGQYRLSFTGIGAWAAQSAVLDGRDVLDAPLDVVATSPISGLAVTLTDRPSEISGTLFDQLGRPAPEYAVVAFPVDPALRTSAPRRSSGLVRLGTDGKYAIVGLPAGDYFLAAVTDLDPAQLNDPGLLELMRAG